MENIKQLIRQAYNVTGTLDNSSLECNLMSNSDADTPDASITINNEAKEALVKKAIALMLATKDKDDKTLDLYNELKVAEKKLFESLFKKYDEQINKILANLSSPDDKPIEEPTSEEPAPEEPTPEKPTPEEPTPVDAKKENSESLQDFTDSIDVDKLIKDIDTDDSTINKNVKDAENSLTNIGKSIDKMSKEDKDALLKALKWG